MSTHYRIELYFPVDRLEAAFVELIQHIDERKNQPYDIRLPNGGAITTFCSSTKPPDIYHGPTGIDWIGFDTIILFPVDVVIQEYMDQVDVIFAEGHGIPKTKEVLVIKDGEKHFPVGYLHVSIGNGKKYAKMTVGSVVGIQNKMIRYSPSIHSMLIHILDMAGGVVGVIDTADYNYVNLRDTTQTIYQNRELFDDGEDTDGICEAFIAALTKH